jgi:hypothetical protein
MDLKESAEANGDPCEDCTVSYMEFQDAIANMKICEYPSSNPWDLFKETAKTEENPEIPVDADEFPKKRIEMVQSAIISGHSDSIELRYEETPEIPADEESKFLSIASAEHGGVVCVHPCQIREGDGCIPNPDPDVRQREDCQWYYQDPRLIRLSQENPGVFVGMGHGGPFIVVADTEENPEIPADEVLEIPDQRRYNSFGQGTCSGC